MEVSAESKELKVAKVIVVMEEREARLIASAMRSSTAILRMDSTTTTLLQVLAEKIEYSLDSVSPAKLHNSIPNISNSEQWQTAAIHSAVEKEHAGRDMQTGQTVSQTSQQVAAQGLPRV